MCGTEPPPSAAEVDGSLPGEGSPLRVWDQVSSQVRYLCMPSIPARVSLMTSDSSPSLLEALLQLTLHKLRPADRL